MWALAHAGLGWSIGVSSPASDRRLRLWCTVAALVPEIGALAAIFGKASYDRLHLPLGHNLFAGLLCVGAAAWAFRSYPDRTWIAAIVFITVSFAVHLLIDMKLTGSQIFLFWPFDRRGRMFETLVRHDSPLLVIAAWILVGLPWGLACWKWVTPLEMVSPGLDGLFLNLFRWKKHACHACGKKCNNRCRGCAKPICLRHGKLGWHFRLTCATCRSGSVSRIIKEGVDDYVARQLQFFRGKEAVRLDPEFASFLHRKLTLGLRRLDALPRSHAFWVGSDGKPTLAKVVELSRLILRDAPEDQEARWVVFADRILTCSPDLEYSVIEPVVLSDFASIRWLAAAARWNFAFSGVDPVTSLRPSFDRLGKLVGSVEDLLRQLRSDPSASTSEAAGHCLDLLHGKNPFKV
jgi:hypothetical protein